MEDDQKHQNGRRPKNSKWKTIKKFKKEDDHKKFKMEEDQKNQNERQTKKFKIEDYQKN